MADGIEARITGLPEFKARLEALGTDMERRIVRSAALAAGTVFRKAAIFNAPILQYPKKGRIAGALKKSIFSARSRSKSSPGTEIVVVGVKSGAASAKTGRDAFYWRWVEAGHLARGPGQKIKGGKRRATLERARLTASGSKFVPGVFYLKRAFTENVARAIIAFNDRIEARIQKANRDINNR